MWEGLKMNIKKRLTDDDLSGIEAKLCVESLTAQAVATLLADFRKRYLQDNPVLPIIDSKPSPLWDYTKEINTYFGRPLMEPCGMTILADPCKHHDTLSFDLQQLILLREEGKILPKKKSLGEILRDVFSFSSKEIGESVASYYEKKAMEKSRYERALPKYDSFFQQLKTMDLNSFHMRHSDASFENVAPTKNILVDTLLSTVVINHVYVSMSTVTYDFVTNKVLSSETFE